MFYAMMFLLFAGCDDKKQEEATEPEKKNDEIDCLKACQTISADVRKGPSYIKFHWKNQGYPEELRCFEAAIEEAKEPYLEAGCKEKGIAKCEVSCKKMTEREKK